VTRIALALEDQKLALNYPEGLHTEIEALFGSSHAAVGTPTHTIDVREDGCPEHFSIQCDGATKSRGLRRDDCLFFLLGEVVHALITDLSSGVALHSGAVLWGSQGILLPGATGAGKSCLTAWLADKGFSYLTDECVVLRPQVPWFSPLTRPIVTKDHTSISITELKKMNKGPIVPGGDAIFWPQNAAPADQPRNCQLVVFPRFEDGAQLRIESLGAAQTALELTACNVNARNLSDHGFGIVTSFARRVPAIMIRYGSFEQLEGALDIFLKLLVESDLGPQAVRRLTALFQTSQAANLETSPLEFPPASPERSGAPDATPRGEPRKLTIGMAAYDDYDGVFFTLQALRMYHPEIVDKTEFVVIDNNPEGPCAAPMKALEHSIPSYRYVPCQDWSGTIVKGRVFEEASGEFVLCLDCHVFVLPGAIRRLLEYFEDNPETNDLLQGPLIYDDLVTFSTHFEPKWRTGMFGCWETDERGRDPEAKPFEIPMQGTGLFACRRAAWPGFNSKFRGFGGEEGYIHEKFRRAGGRTLCLPFLRWMHRFNRPMGIPYENTWDDRIRNYMIGFTELGFGVGPVEEHFREFLGPSIADPIIEQVKMELGHATS
jgi:Glycosyl transferase family 2